ncbi:MAG: ATP-binding protein [Desulfosporosinus sp.]|nr:ATP-binding protein [Desulfosporosinus sp.]
MKKNSPKKSCPSASSRQDLRRRAEEMVQGKTVLTSETLVMTLPEEMQQTLHELRVHQIELEMQNEELRRAQTELDATRTRYFELYDLAPVGYCTISEKGLILESNLTASNLLGVARGALNVQPIISRYILKEDQGTYYQHRKQLLETDEPQSCELRMLKSDGTVFWGHMTMISAQDADGEPEFRIALSDITKRKKAEDALKESEEKNRLLIEESIDAIIICDSFGKIITCNKAMENFSESKLSNLEEINLWDSQYQLAPDDKRIPKLLEFLKTKYMSIVSKSISWPGKTIEQKVALPNGTVKTVVDSTYSIDTQKGILYVTILHDISDLKRREEELKIAQADAKAADAAKCQFLANMSHEMRTPMSVVMGMLQLMQMTELTEEQKEYLRLSKTSSDALLLVINDILDYSKIDAGMMELVKTPFDIAKVLENSVGLFQVAAAEKGLIITTFLAEDVPNNLIGDSFRLRQVLTNLIGNAVKYTKKGKIDVTVKKIGELNRKEIKLEFVVKDTGIGIAADKRDVLFKCFSQVDNSNTRNYGGTGLGLSICKGLVAQMAGKIWVESIEGEGSSFYFTCVLEIGATE